MGLINLHVHSMYSLRDSIIRPDDLIERLNEINQHAVAITDHGGSLGGISLYKKLTAANIKYIHGCELYICDDVNIKNKDSKYNHLIVLCKNEIGRLNLNKLISMSEHPDRKYFKPRVDFKMLSENKDGLIILSACLAGEVSRAIQSGDIDSAKKIASRYLDCFGSDYYLEIQSHGDSLQMSVNKSIAEIGRDLNIPVVITTDAHYTREEDRDYQNKYAFNGNYKEDGEAYIDCFLQSEDEIRQRLSYFYPEDVNEFILNTHRIADKCNLEMPLSAPIMPHVNTPPTYSSNVEWLKHLCEDGFRNKLHIQDMAESKRIEYRERYEYELDSLSRMGFIDYILLVHSYANVAQRRGIARGSGGGSLICYLTNITNIDPLEYGLYFERFIDVGALTRLEAGEITAKELKVPDVDLDFGSDSCAEVLKFLYQTYGEENVASIGKFGTNLTNGTIRDMCRVFNIDIPTTNTIAKAFENFELSDIDAILTSGKKPPDMATTAINCIKKYPDLFRYVRKLIGLPKSFGLHACGKVISTRQLDEFLPSCYDTNGIRFIQGDMHDVEDVGLVKIDVLGLRTIDQMYDTLEQSQKTIEYIDPKLQDYSDDRVLDIFRDGNTIGIFQFSSKGMRETLKKMGIRCINDLAVANALFRPGAMAYIDNFCRRKDGIEELKYIHPDLEPILKDTFGIIVFQEQLIQVGRMAGMHNPDLLRKATGKKDAKLLASVKPELEGLLQARGWNQQQFDDLWADMLAFASYSFNKSHAAAYAIIAYLTAKQKAYYPAQFFAGLCNSYIGQGGYVKDNADEIINDMFRNKVKIAPFNFRNDHRKCSVTENGMLLYGIPLISECNQTVADYLYEIRNEATDKFWHLLRNILASKRVNKPQLSALIKLGFFNEFGNSRKLLRIYDTYQFLGDGTAKQIAKKKLDANEYLYDIIQKHSRDTNAKGVELKSFIIDDIDTIMDDVERYIIGLDISDFSFKEKIEHQREYLGFVSLTTGKEEDRRIVYVKSIRPAYRKKDGAMFGYNIVTRSVGSGKESMLTIFNKYYEDPIVAGDMLKLIHWTVEKGQYFNLDKYQVLLN